MSFPASGMVESAYRNSINDVSLMLSTSHKDAYMVWNLSGRRYDESLFHGGQVVNEYSWLDHHAPPLHVLCKIILNINSWLMAEPENVAVIHCLAGKGRTGTVICGYLVYSATFFDTKNVSPLVR